MYICNLKLNSKKVLFVCLAIAIVIALSIEIVSLIKNSSNNSYDYVLDSNNYTNVLKSVHNNIEQNVGKTIKLSGFIFTLPDFKDGYFVCGRNMMLNSDEKVVGFLCTFDNMTNFSDAEWVEITGTIEKGYYMADMPVIRVDTINKITAPANTFVNPPSA